MHFFYYAENKTHLDICLIFDLLNHLRNDKSFYKHDNSAWEFQLNSRYQSLVIKSNRVLYFTTLIKNEVVFSYLPTSAIILTSSSTYLYFT